MNKIEGELISALLDGEIEPEAHRNTVSRLLDAGPEALDTYGRYRLIGDLMRDETAQVVPVADEVHAALREEPTVLVPQTPSPLRWLRPLGGVALAASVAAVAIVVAPQMIPQFFPDGQVAEIVREPPRVAVAPQFVASKPSPTAQISADRRAAAAGAPRWRALDADLETRLNRLVIEHHEFAGRTGVTGPVPHISVVSYDPR